MSYTVQHHQHVPTNCTKGIMATIQKRGDVYRAIVRKAGNKSVSKSFGKRSDALRWANEIEAQMEEGKYRKGDPDLGVLCRRYLNEIIPLRPCGRTKKETIKFLAKELTGVPLSKLSPSWLLSYAKDRAVSPATLNQDIIFLGAALKAANTLWDTPVDLDLWAKSVDTIKTYGLIGKSNERDRRTTDDELATVILHIASDIPMADLIAFAVDSSMRISEITSIRWADVNTTDRTVLIRNRKHPRVKIGNNQTVPLLGRCFELIQRQPNVDARIFPYEVDSISTAFRRACVKVGVSDLRWHDLRHEGISRLFEKGYLIQEVALVSGHRSWDQLKRYTKLRVKDLHR